MKKTIKKAIYLKTDGTSKEITPVDGKNFSLKELQDYVGGSRVIDIQDLPKSNRVMILDDNGKCEGQPKNEKATEIWKEEYPIEEYPFNNDELIVGDVVVCDNKLIN